MDEVNGFLVLQKNLFISFCRFYSVLYKKIGETELFQSSHHAMLINLLFKALKQDNEKNRICAFIKRILEVRNINYYC